MSLRPAIELPENATVEYPWESVELGAYVTAVRGYEDDGFSCTEVTLWLLAPDAPEITDGIYPDRSCWCKTLSGEMRRWVTVEWPPIYGETHQWIDAFEDNSFASTTLNDVVTESKERAAAYAISRRAAITRELCARRARRSDRVENESRPVPSNG